MPTDFATFLPVLKELQEIDKQLRKINDQLHTIPEQFATQGAEYFTTAKVLQDKEARLESINKERLELEMLLKETAATLENREKRLNAITTPKEYQAAVKEVASAR